MTRARQLLNRLWFAKAPAARLAMLRILVGVYFLCWNLHQFSLFIEVAHTGRSLFVPVGIVDLLSEPMSAEGFRVLLITTVVANVAFILGWRYRYTGPAFAGLLWWILSYRNSWSMIYHSDNVALLHVTILGAVPAADAGSMDARRRVVAARIQERPISTEDSWRYGWPIRLICAVTLATYFLAGVAKVSGPLGWSWASASGLRDQMAADCLRKELLAATCPSSFHALYSQTWLFGILAPLSLAVELGAPVALLMGRRLARVWVTAAFMMHWGICALMGIEFRYQLSGFAFLAFFDVECILTPFQKVVTAVQLKWGSRGRSEGLEPLHRRMFQKCRLLTMPRWAPPSITKVLDGPGRSCARCCGRVRVSGLAAGCAAPVAAPDDRH